MIRAIFVLFVLSVGSLAQAGDIEELQARYEAVKARREAAFHMRERGELMAELGQLRERLAAAEEIDLKRKLEAAKKRSDDALNASPKAPSK